MKLQIGSKSGKEYVKAIYSPCLFNLYAEYIMHKAQAGIKIAGRNSNNLRYAYHPYGRKWRRTKEPLGESEREEWKCLLKTQYSEN